MIIKRGLLHYIKHHNCESNPVRTVMMWDLMIPWQL